MTAQQLLRQLRSSGIRVAVKGDKLDLEGPCNVLTADLVETVRTSKMELIRLLRGKRHAAQRPTCWWPPEAAKAISWFRDNRNRLPSSPYQLRQDARVSDPARFHESLDRDIERGPDGPRSTYGGLMFDVQSLRQVLRDWDTVVNSQRTNKRETQ